MKKPTAKKNIKSTHYGAKALFNHPAQHSVGNFEDKKTDPSEIGIDHLTAYIDRIKEARTDGYWSVLKEEL
jgi:hypothetical protein